MPWSVAGVLVNLASDGAHAWTIPQPGRLYLLSVVRLAMIITVYRDQVMSRVARAINSWDIQTELNVRSHTLTPHISLGRVSHTPECQLWAMWTLANYTTVKPDKYCKILVEEEGLSLVDEILNNGPGQGQELARIVR